VTIGTPTVIPRETGTVEVDVPFTPNASATASTYAGVSVFLEDPDISSGTEAPLDGSMPLDGSAQVSGQWNPQRDQNTKKSPVAVLIPEGGVDRTVRIYLAAFGPNSTAQLVRANDTTQTPTPSVVVTIPAVSDTYVIGQDYAWLVTNQSVTVNSLFNLPQPMYTLTFDYSPPSEELEAHRPPGIGLFGGVAIWYEYFATGVRLQAMQQPYVATSPQNPLALAWTSTQYVAGTGSFRVYFVSMDDGGHQNQIVPGITPSVDVTIDPNPQAPKVTHLQIVPGSASVVYLQNKTFVSIVTFSWTLPTAATGLARYAGLFLYRVATTGSAPCPVQLPGGAPAATDTQATVDVSNIPATPEDWTIAAIAVDVNGQLEDDPKTYGKNPGWSSPVVVWTVGPPGIGVIGGGQEFAPLVTLNSGATATPAESTSSDGVRMVTFAINGTNGAWTNPTSNQFGGAWVALVVNNDTSHATYWHVPQSDNKFTTPAIAAPGAFGQAIGLAFYIISEDPQNNRNHLVNGVTPEILLSYTPSEGMIIPSRNAPTALWLSNEFQWSSNVLTVDSIGAGKIQVGSLLQVGGKNSFAGAQNGQIAVFDSSSKLVGWIGMAVYDGSKQQTVGAQNFGGAWFSQLWVGGDSPDTAPLFVNQQGVVIVGGISAPQGSQYPYISVRDYYGIERGRIGAQLANGPGLGGGVTPPATLTAGAWFTQFAAGGQSSGDWQVFIDGSSSPGKFYIRDTDQFSIFFPTNSSTSSNSAYYISMGKGVWSGVASAGNTYQFPGIQIYEASGTPPFQIFGSVLLNRGLVLRGTPAQGNNVMVSLVMFNGDNLGSDYPQQFWGELAMYSPNAPTQNTVDLASGSSTSGAARFYLRDQNGNQNFGVGETGDVVYRGALGLNNANTGGSIKPLIDVNGNWVGGMAGGSVTSVTASAGGAGLTVSPTTGAVVITNTGVTSVYGSTGVSVTAFSGHVGILIGQDVQTTSNVTFQQIDATGPVIAHAFGTGIGFKTSNLSFSVDGYGDMYSASIALTPNGTSDAIHVGGKQCCDYAGNWKSNVATQTGSVGAASLAIWYNGGYVFGAPLANQLTFRTGDGRTVTVTGGLITSVV
jgi:hypothetical protein